MQGCHAAWRAQLDVPGAARCAPIASLHTLLMDMETHDPRQRAALVHPAVLSKLRGVFI